MIYHFIVNPRARSGLGEMLWKQLEPELCRKRIDYQIHLTTKKKDAGKIGIRDYGRWPGAHVCCSWRRRYTQ